MIRIVENKIVENKKSGQNKQCESRKETEKRLHYSVTLFCNNRQGHQSLHQIINDLTAVQACLAHALFAAAAATLAVAWVPHRALLIVLPQEYLVKVDITVER